MYRPRSRWRRPRRVDQSSGDLSNVTNLIVRPQRPIADFCEDYRVPINTASRFALLNCAFLIIFIKVNEPIDVTQQPQKNEGKNDQVHVVCIILSSKVLTPSSLGSSQPHCGMSTIYFSSVFHIIANCATFISSPCSTTQPPRASSVFSKAYPRSHLYNNQTERGTEVRTTV